MIRRDITVTIPRADGRPWVAVQIEVPDDSPRGWASVQARPVTAQGRQRRLTIPCSFPDDAEVYRVVWVPEGGSAAGLRPSAPATFKD